LIQNIKNLRQTFLDTNYKFKIIAGCVMPEHIHFIIKPENINELSKIIKSIKYNFSKSLPKSNNLSDSLHKRKEKGIWQRRFYDHIIRKEDDLYRHLDYIHYNPIKHGIVQKAKDWDFSSFNKFVKLGLYDENWCNFEDKNNINNMDLECRLGIPAQQ